MISSIVWVPAGVADPTPKKYEMSAQEMEIIRLLEEQQQSQQQTPDAKKMRGGMLVKATSTPLEHNLPADLRMDEYSDDDDDDDDGDAAVGRLLISSEGAEGMEDDQAQGEEDEDNEEDQEGEKKMHGDNDDDDDDSDDDEDDLEDVPDTREFEPVDVEGLQAMGLNQIGNSAMHMEGLGDDEDDDSEAENVKLSDTDAIVLVAKTEDDFAAVEVHVYDQVRGNMYVHHDIPLPSYPLCLVHGRVSSSGTLGNFCAVGTFNPGIEVWNLDVLNALEPACVLGGEETSGADEMMKMEILGGKMPAKRGRETALLRPGSHTDAVMSLSWNQIHQQVIASGSADKTVKLWDITKADSDTDKCNASTFTHHRDKVQAVEWHPKESTLLATGSFDRTIALLDARTNGENVKRVKIQSDCEALAWDPFHPEYLTVATEDGTLCCWDVRKFETNSPTWTMLSSEFGGLNDLAYNPNIPGMLATCSVDKTVTLWDTFQNGAFAPSTSPRQIMTKDMCAGKLYTVKFYPSSPWLMGCGGSGKELTLWNLDSEARLESHFSGRDANSQVSGEAPNQTEEDFEAMMAEKETSKSKNRTPKGKKKSESSKKKVHKRNRR